MKGHENLDKRLTVNVEEFAQIVGIGRNTAYECVRRGVIPSIRLGRRIIIPVKAIERLIGCDDESITLPTAQEPDSPCKESLPDTTESSESHRNEGG